MMTRRRALKLMLAASLVLGGAVGLGLALDAYTMAAIDPFYADRAALAERMAALHPLVPVPEPVATAATPAPADPAAEPLPWRRDDLSTAPIGYDPDDDFSDAGFVVIDPVEPPHARRAIADAPGSAAPPAIPEPDPAAPPATPDAADQSPPPSPR